MAAYARDNIQTVQEIRTYTIDYTDDLPVGGTVTAGTATHIPPLGNALPVGCAVINPYVYVTVPALGVTGVHYVDVLATFNNGDKSPIRVEINAVYAATLARPGLVDLITELRSMTDASASDYSLGGLPYWTDLQLQAVLDKHRTEIKFLEMDTSPDAPVGGNVQYHDYTVGWGNLEQTTGGTLVFIVQDVLGNSVPLASYTPDYQRCLVTFAVNTLGLTYFVTARSYDLDGAAAEVWRKKQVHYHTAINFITDNQSLSRESLFSHAREMAAYYESIGRKGMSSIQMVRDDTDEI